MASSNNIIELSSAVRSSDPALSIRTSFISLLTKHIFPAINPAIDDMLQELLSRSQSADNNNQATDFMDAYSSLKSSQKKIRKNFIKFLKETPDEDPRQKQSEKNTLVLMDNRELEKKLISQVSSQVLMIDESTPLLVSIASRLANLENCVHLISPENLCTSFEKAISSALTSLSIEIEELLLNIFSRNLRKPTLAMWEEADQLLESEGFQTKKNYEHQDKVEPHNTANNTITTETLLLENITSNVLSKVEHLINERTNTETSPSLTTEKTLESSDLAGTLSVIQMDLLNKLTSIEDLAESIKEALEAQGVNQKLSSRHQDLINMVGMLFEFILDDHQLNSDVRKLIGLLQIPILKLALLDQNFLRDRHHPARDLLNEMTSAGMSCGEQTPPDDPVILIIEEIVRAIIAHSDDSDIFNQSLEMFRLELKTLSQQSQHDNTTENTPPDFRPDDHIQHNEAAADIIDEDQEATDNLDTESSTKEEKIEEIILQSDSISNSNAFKESCKSNYDEEAFQPIKGLFIGQWIEFIGTSERSLRCQLANIDNLHDRYTFVNSAGMKVAEKSGETLKKELEKGAMKILDDTPRFDKALQTVMNKFLRF